MKIVVINPNYERFHAVFCHLLDRDWKRKQKALSFEVGVSPGFISDIKSGKASAGKDMQAKFAEAMGYLDFDEFLAIGRSLIEPPGDGSETPLPKKTGPSNVIQFNGHSVIDTKTEKMYRDLDAILKSGDEELIDAIRMNLMSFRKKVELQNQIEEQGKRIAALEASIK